MPWTYDPNLQPLLYTDVAFKSYAYAGEQTYWSIAPDPEVPFFKIYDTLTEAPHVGGTVYSWSYDPSLGALSYADYSFKASATALSRTYWRATYDPEIPFPYIRPNAIYEDLSDVVPNTSTPFLYDPYYQRLSYGDFAFRSKAIATQISFWRGIPDPEHPSIQSPVAIVDPPYQEIGKNQYAAVSGANSRATANNPGVVIISYEWDWGDGSLTSFGVTATHQYTSLGEFIGTLTVSDSAGNQDIASFHVSVLNNLDYRVLYMISEGGVLGVTFNDGVNWRQYNMRALKFQTAGSIQGRSVAVDPDNRLIAYFGFSDGRLYRTDDGLLSVADPLVDLGFQADSIDAIEVDPFAGFFIYFGTKSGKLYNTPTFLGNGNPTLIFDFGQPIQTIAISRGISNTMLVGGNHFLALSKDNGETWTYLDTTLNCKRIQFSKLDSRYAYAADGSQALKIDIQNQTISNRITESSTILDLSSVAQVDGIIASRADTRFIRKSIPFGSMINGIAMPTSPLIPYATHVLADASNRDKWFWTYDNWIFKTYQSTYAQIVPAYTQSYIILRTYGEVKQIAQGNLVSIYDSSGWDFPGFPPIDIPPIYIPSFPTFPPFPPFGNYSYFPPIYVLPIYVPPIYTYTHGVEFPGGSYPPIPPIFPPIPIPPINLPVGSTFDPNIPTFDPLNFDDLLDGDSFLISTTCVDSSDVGAVLLEIMTAFDGYFKTSAPGNFEVGGYYKIGSEIVLVTSISGSYVYCDRAQLGTIAYAHFRTSHDRMAFGGRYPSLFTSGGVTGLESLLGSDMSLTDTQCFVAPLESVSIGDIFALDNELMRLTALIDAQPLFPTIDLTGWKIGTFIRSWGGTAAVYHFHGSYSSLSSADAPAFKAAGAFDLPVDKLDSEITRDISKTVNGHSSLKIKFQPTFKKDISGHGPKIGLNIMATGQVSVGFFCYMQWDDQPPSVIDGHNINLITAMEGFDCSATPIAAVGFEHFGDQFDELDELYSALDIYGYRNGEYVNYYPPPAVALIGGASQDITRPGSDVSFDTTSWPHDQWFWVCGTFDLQGYHDLGDNNDPHGHLSGSVTDIFGSEMLTFTWYDTPKEYYQADDFFGDIDYAISQGAQQITRMITGWSGDTATFATDPTNKRRGFPGESSIFIGPILAFEGDGFNGSADAEANGDPDYGWKDYLPKFTIWINNIIIKQGVNTLLIPPHVDLSKVVGDYVDLR